MRNLPLSFLGLAIIMTIVSSSPSWAVINNNGGATGKNGDCKDGYAICVDWCGKHNKTDSSFDKCEFQCYVYWCSNGGSKIGKPKPGANSTPIINGKPVEAPPPPPPKGGNPTNAEPITTGKPTQASPSGGKSGGKLK
jgi:hypothetical protein